VSEGESGTKFSLGRERVTTKQYGEDGKLQINGGTLREIEYDPQRQEIIFRGSCGLILLATSDFALLETKGSNKIVIRCTRLSIEINGVNAEIEIKSIAELIEKNCSARQYQEEEIDSAKDSGNDIDGHYTVLGVKNDATQEEIKKAYRKRSLEVHPDVNKDSNAQELFVRLKKAYEILGNSQNRSEYDAQCIKVPGANANTDANSKDVSLEPIRCSVCNCVTAQPRYVVFWETISFIKTVRSPVQGIMCIKCAGKAGVDATRKSLVLGWWGIWGLLLTPVSVITNLSGGERPAENNGRILLHQSWYFAQKNRPDIAYFLASDSLRYLKASSAVDKEELMGLCERIIDTCSSFAKGKEMEMIWDKGLPMVVEQWKAVGICLVIGSIGIGAIGSYLETEQKKAVEGAPQYSYQNQEAPPREMPSESATAVEPVQPAPIPSIYLPLTTGYLPDKEIRDNSGYSELTLKNNSDSNFHVKLYNWYSGQWMLSREAYVKAQEEFKMNDLSPGKYEIRKMDVQTKNANKSESFTLEETRSATGVEYSTMTLTFNAYRGNSSITPISAGEF
jgi:hypothetical protein